MTVQGGLPRTSKPVKIVADVIFAQQNRLGICARHRDFRQTAEKPRAREPAILNSLRIIPRWSAKRSSLSR